MIPPHAALILFTEEQELGICEVTEQQLRMERTFTGKFMLCCFRQQFHINYLSCPRIAELSACFSDLFLSWAASYSNAGLGRWHQLDFLCQMPAKTDAGRRGRKEFGVVSLQRQLHSPWSWCVCFPCVVFPSTANAVSFKWVSVSLELERTLSCLLLCSWILRGLAFLTKHLQQIFLEFWPSCFLL